MDISEPKKKEVTDRTQKLTSALYRVTDLLYDKEPLKWSLRNSALEIYNNFTRVLLPYAVAEKGEIINQLLNEISQVVSILELAASGTSISSFNFEILKKEYLNLRAFIEGNKNDMVQEQKLLPEFSTSEYPKPAPPAPLKQEPQKVIGQLNPNGHNHNGHPERKVKILDFLKDGGNKSIAEIATIFSGISEKTVQRDIFDLVREGKLETKGEKRWRVYKLATRV